MEFWTPKLLILSLENSIEEVSKSVNCYVVWVAERNLGDNINKGRNLVWFQGGASHSTTGDTGFSPDFAISSHDSPELSFLILMKKVVWMTAENLFKHKPMRKSSTEDSERALCHDAWSWLCCWRLSDSISDVTVNLFTTPTCLCVARTALGYSYISS